MYRSMLFEELANARYIRESVGLTLNERVRRICIETARECIANARMLRMLGAAK